ncbi:MAG: hypothetical protein AAGF99_15300 [Bacteroidota bacterium]
MMFSRALLFGLLCFAPAWSAYAQDAACTPGQTYVYFGNGVNTTRAEARANARYLRNTMIVALMEDVEGFRWGYAYNETAADDLPLGAFFDFVQSFDQWNDDLDVSFYRWLSGIEIMPDWVQSALLDWIDVIDAANWVIDRDLRAHANRYSELIEQGNRVFVVSHSQGNYYANQAHRLVESESMEIVAVASPASLVEGGGNYVSLTGDLVVELTPRSLAPNVTNPSRGDLFNHGFAESYLGGPNSRQLLISHFRTATNATEFPESEIGRGIITVRLTWGAEPDLDLHAFEPNGTQVFYANQSGLSGFLDVDDVTSFGPEHYYVACETLEEGLYAFGVNYYGGSGPETAQLQVTAGTVTRNYSRTFTRALGSSGNASPTIMSQVTVTERENGTYDFEVRGGPAFAPPADPPGADATAPKGYSADQRHTGPALAAAPR